MSAETLRRAASLMRERAEAATEGPWMTWADPKPGIDKAAVETAWTRGDPEDGGSLVTDWCDVPDAEHIASWHPAVALAVADWLATEAGEWEVNFRATQAPSHGVDQPPAIHYGDPKGAAENADYHARRALTVALTYLGDTP